VSDAAVAAIARRQHGLVTLAQLRLHLSPAEIRHRVDRGRLQRVFAGVFRVAGAPESWDQMALAAVLASGEGAVVSFLAGAYVWNIAGFWEQPQCEITTPSRRRTRLEGVIVHDSEILDGLHVDRRRSLEYVDLRVTRGDDVRDEEGALVLVPGERAQQGPVAEADKEERAHRPQTVGMLSVVARRRALSEEALQRARSAEELPLPALRLPHQARHLLATKTRSDIADIDQMVAAPYAGHQRPELASVATPCADDDLVSGTAFGLGPAIAAPGRVRCIRSLGYDAFQGHSAGGFENRVATAFEVLDIPDRRLLLLVDLLEQILESALPVDEKSTSEILTF